MDVVYYTNKGGREVNEDSLFMTDGAYVVCDGLGGHDSGEVASNCAVKVMSELCSADTPYTPDLINTFYLRANQAVIALKEQALTTIVGGFIRDGIFYYQSVGDSRLYYFRDNRRLTQTKDDSVCQAAVDLGSMDYEDIRTSEDRSRLLKVLGNDPELKIIRRYDPITMQEGDAFLVCSDGFWEHVLDGEMEDTLRDAVDAEEWLNVMLRIQYSRAKNHDDNYTVICGIIGQEDVTGKVYEEEPKSAAPEKQPEMTAKTPEDPATETSPAGTAPPEHSEAFKEHIPEAPASDGSQFKKIDSGKTVEYSDDEVSAEPEKRGFFSRLFGR